MDTLTIMDLRRLAVLDDAILNNRRCRWAVGGDSSRVIDGIARHYVKSATDFAFMRGDADVRDGFVRFSGTFEIALSVREILDLMAEELFYVER